MSGFCPKMGSVDWGLCLCVCVREKEAWTLHLWAGLFLKSFGINSSSLSYCWQSSSQSWEMDFLALNSSHQGPLPVSYSVFIFWSDTMLLVCPCKMIQSEVNVYHYQAVWFRPQVIPFPIVFSLLHWILADLSSEGLTGMQLHQYHPNV